VKAYHAWFAVSYVLTAAGGVVLGIAITEEKARKKYEEANASYRRAVELAQNMKGDKPAATEEELDTPLFEGPVEVTNLSLDAEPNVWGGTLKIIPEEERNQYHKAISATETPHNLFVDGAVNDYGVSYIEEEEYQEEDGRYKGQLTLTINDGEPEVFMDGVMIDDWDERVGQSIVVDFTQLVPPGINPVLYVRNHTRDEDYEVILESP
jgi:hypothetical protein